MYQHKLDPAESSCALASPLPAPAEPAPVAQESLDPEDWESFRALAHRMLDRVIDLQRDVRLEPVWRPLPEAIEERFREPLPEDGIGLEAACDDFLTTILPYRTGNIHPRFWGWVSGTGTPSGLVAEMLAGGINSISSIFNDASGRVETQVVDWMKEALGFDPDASGILTSGGSVGNLVALTVARDAILGGDVVTEGLTERGSRPVLYASSEVHSSVVKATQILGLGSGAVRIVPVDRDYRIVVPALLEAIARDRSEGFAPFAIVANAGTVNTGATDDLDAVADVAADEGLWMHVDGAFGALAALAPQLREVVRGLDRADSVAFDFHKWMYMQYEAGCVLIRDAAAHRASFSAPASYLVKLPRGTSAVGDSAEQRGLQLSRGFKSLKVWLQLKEHGVARYGRMIARNVAQARTLAGLVDAAPELELAAPVPLNVVCFRYAPEGVAAERLDVANQEILMRLQESGVAVPSSTVLDGRFVLRVAIVNHRSRDDDFELLVAAVRKLGARWLEREKSGDNAR